MKREHSHWPAPSYSTYITSLYKMCEGIGREIKYGELLEATGGGAGGAPGVLAHRVLVETAPGRGCEGVTSPARPALARARTMESKSAQGSRAPAPSPAESEIVVEWPRGRKLTPRLVDVSTGERARCRAADGCSRVACYPDARCALHTAWLSGGASERIAADSWIAGPAGHRRAQAWALWRVRIGLPRGDAFVPLRPEGT